jgi:hypothetical protein
VSFTKKIPEAERFWAKVDLLTPSGCWLWLPGAGSNGYGKFTLSSENVGVDGKTVSAHRWAYEFLIGPIPDGKSLDHVQKRGCVSKLCVNPTHLEPVTSSENRARFLDGRTVCKRGHTYTDRVCRECKNIRQAEYRERQKENL